MATATVTTSIDKFRFHSAVRGYHVYRSVWDPFLDDTFTTMHKKANSHEKYAIAVMPEDSKRKEIVGHVPREISKLCCLFILFGGTIVGRVTGRRRKTAADCAGMEIPCEIFFKHTQKKVLDKPEILLKNSKQNSENKQPKNSKQLREQAAKEEEAAKEIANKRTSSSASA